MQLALLDSGQHPTPLAKVTMLKNPKQGSELQTQPTYFTSVCIAIKTIKKKTRAEECWVSKNIATELATVA